MEVVAYVALGANLGARAETLKAAAEEIARLPQTRLLGCSSLYSTAPLGGPPQPDFLNAVIQVKTALSPEALLGHLHAVENFFGRTRSCHWGPRTLDLDLLAHGDHHSAGPDPATLQLPHPRMGERKFVLVPLKELAPAWVHPVSRATIAQLLQACPDRGVPMPVKADWPPPLTPERKVDP